MDVHQHVNQSKVAKTEVWGWTTGVFLSFILSYSLVRLKARLLRPAHPTSSLSDSSLPTNILRSLCMQTGKTTAAGMQLQVLIGTIFLCG